MKKTAVTFKEAKMKNEKITMLTAYDYSMAKLIDESGINGILVGDSLGMVCLGYEDTLSVTMEDIIHHTNHNLLTHLVDLRYRVKVKRLQGI